jgi:hypothetical protein
LCEILQNDASLGAAYEQLYRNLGPGVIHVSTDAAEWQPTGTPSCGTPTVLTESEVDAFFAFVQRIGWKVLWGLPLATFDPSAAAAEASYVASVGSGALVGWTIGNEPNLYVDLGTRPPGWDYTDYYQEWTQTRDAVIAAVPGVAIVGPDACCEDVVFTQSFAAEAGKEVSAISFHAYFPTPQTVETLLSAAAMQEFATGVTALWNVSAAVGQLPLYLDETNTYAGGGQQGVSNTFVSALWLSDLLFEAADLHVGQVDVQESHGGDPYDPIGLGGQPEPVYYGMLLFHSVAGSDSHMLETRIQTSLNLTAYAVQAGDGSTRVVLVNKTGNDATVEVDTGRTYHNAYYYRLQAPNLSSTAGVTLGASAVSSQGTWAPNTNPLPLTGKTATIPLPPDSVTCIVEVGGRA